MVPLCTLVHTSRGPTPRNQPAMPSVLYMSFSPVKIDEVSRLTEPGFVMDVFGEDVEISLVCLRTEEDMMLGLGKPFGTGLTVFGRTLLVLIDVTDSSVGFNCVCILVFTTSSGHVMTPAKPPALDAVSISRARPISRLPAQALAHFCSCS